MRALTVYQPWATLIMIGAKPYEFRKWDYRDRDPSLVDQRLVVHAGVRIPKPDEVRDILQRIDDGHSALNADIAEPILEHLLHELAAIADWKRSQRRKPRKARLPMVGDLPTADESGEPTLSLPLGAGLGTATLGTPKLAHKIFRAPTNDSYRMDHSMWAWPMKDPRPFDNPIEVRGAQGFWTWPDLGKVVAA